jgi:hypothetical protein
VCISWIIKGLIDGVMSKTEKNDKLMLTALSRKQVLSYETENDESTSWVVTLGG